MLSFQSSKINPLESMESYFKKALENVDLSFFYPDPSGSPELRELLKEYHPHWSGECLITNSATEATFLALSLLEGKTLALNVPSYFGVLRQAKHFNINILEWETVDDLLKLKNYDGVLLTSNFTPPTGKSFSNKEKEIIAEFANNNNALVIEDNAYEFLSYGKEKLTSIKADSIVHINSFSKIMSPSLRLGFLMASDNIYKKLRSTKITMNLSSSPISQSIICDVLKNTTLVEEWRRELKERSNLLSTCLKEELGVNSAVYDGGSFIKLKLKKEVNLEIFIKEAKEKGILFDDNKNQYSDSQSKNYIRLHIGAITKEEIKESMRILKKLKMNFNS